MIKKFFIIVCIICFELCSILIVEAKDNKPTLNDKKAMLSFLLNDIKNKDFYYLGDSSISKEIVFQNIYNKKYSKAINGSYTANYSLYMRAKEITGGLPPLCYVDVMYNNGNYTIKYLNKDIVVKPKITNIQKMNIVNNFKKITANNVFYINKEVIPFTYKSDNSIEWDWDPNAYVNFKHLDKINVNIQNPDCYNSFDGFYCYIPVTLTNNKNNKITIKITGSYEQNKYIFDINKYLFSSTYYKQKGINSSSYWYKLAKNQEIQINMPEKYLILSWGFPKKINTNVGSWGTNKQYVYLNSYVYIENGKITSWQN